MALASARQTIVPNMVIAIVATMVNSLKRLFIARIRLYHTQIYENTLRVHTKRGRKFDASSLMCLYLLFRFLKDFGDA